MTKMRITEENKGVDSRWMVDALCIDHPELPWIGEPLELGAKMRSRMRAVCAACPVRVTCAAYAVEVKASAGWWAGRSMHRNATGRLVEDEPGSEAA
ncbi:MAG: WhiB family transcriptional regulator [Nocardioidaceae bacterium]